MNLFLWTTLAICTAANAIAGGAFMQAITSKELEFAGSKAGKAILFWFLAYTVAILACGYLIGSNYK